MKNEPVEKYKLTSEQMGFQKQYSKIKKVEQFLQKKLFSKMVGAKQLSDLLRETQMAGQEMYQNAPSNQINDIAGQSK
jgi:hypothetical protein